eukprot:785678-Prymnesium_polylepis.1
MRRVSTLERDESGRLVVRGTNLQVEYPLLTQPPPQIVHVQSARELRIREQRERVARPAQRVAQLVLLASSQSASARRREEGTRRCGQRANAARG